VAVVVSLQSVVEELEALIDETTAYLDRRTGALYAFQDEDARSIEDGAGLLDFPEWQRGEVPKMREILESEDWLPLPTRFDIHEWAIMDAFARSIDDADLRAELLNSIRGAGAFRAFKDAVQCREIHEDWYRYRTAALRQIAADWLDGHGVSYTRDEDASSTT
jgi:hypothetical protein